MGLGAGVSEGRRTLLSFLLRFLSPLFNFLNWSLNQLRSLKASRIDGMSTAIGRIHVPAMMWSCCWNMTTALPAIMASRASPVMIVSVANLKRASLRGRARLRVTLHMAHAKSMKYIIIRKTKSHISKDTEVSLSFVKDQYGVPG